MSILPTQLERTVRCLELMGQSYEALTRDGDPERCDALVDQAIDEAGIETFDFIHGGMVINEIPMPSDERFWPYVDEQRARLPQATDNTETTESEDGR